MLDECANKLGFCMTLDAQLHFHKLLLHHCKVSLLHQQKIKFSIHSCISKTLSLWRIAAINWLVPSIPKRTKCTMASLLEQEAYQWTGFTKNEMAVLIKYLCIPFLFSTPNQCKFTGEETLLRSLTCVHTSHDWIALSQDAGQSTEMFWWFHCIHLQWFAQCNIRHFSGNVADAHQSIQTQHLAVILWNACEQWGRCLSIWHSSWWLENSIFSWLCGAACMSSRWQNQSFGCRLEWVHQPSAMRFSHWMLKVAQTEVSVPLGSQWDVPFCFWEQHPQKEQCHSRCQPAESSFGKDHAMCWQTPTVPSDHTQRCHLCTSFLHVGRANKSSKDHWRKHMDKQIGQKWSSIKNAFGDVHNYAGLFSEQKSHKLLKISEVVEHYKTKKCALINHFCWLAFCHFHPKTDFWSTSWWSKQEKSTSRGTHSSIVGGCAPKCLDAESPWKQVQQLNRKNDAIMFLKTAPRFMGIGVSSHFANKTSDVACSCPLLIMHCTDLGRKFLADQLKFVFIPTRFDHVFTEACVA